MSWKKSVNIHWGEDCEAGLSDRITVKKLLLKKKNNVKRLKWAKPHKDYPTEKWNKDLWSNESNFKILESMSSKELVKELEPSPQYHTNHKA